MASAKENPAASVTGASAAEDAASAASHDIMNSTIEEVESAQQCCTLCPPRIACCTFKCVSCCPPWFTCCPPRPSEKDIEAAAKGFFGSRRRKCTDMFCLVLFFAFWIGMFVIGGIAIATGDVSRLLYGADYRGNTCGVEASVKTMKYTAYPRMLEDFLLNVGKTNPSEWQFYGVCVSKCPQKLDVLCNADVTPQSDATWVPNVKWCLTGGLDGTRPTNGNAFCSAPGGTNTKPVASNCWIIPLNTKSTMFRCIPQIETNSNSTSTCSYPPGITNPNDPACLVKTTTSNGSVQSPAKESQLIEQLATVQSIWSRYFGDLQRAFVPIIVCSIIVTLVLGIIYLLLLQWCTGVIVALTILITLLGLGSASAFCFFKAGILTSPNFVDAASASLGVAVTTAQADSTKQAFAALGYTFCALAIIALILVVSLRNAIATAVATIQIASVALRKNPCLLLTPIFSTAAILGLLAWWGFTAASLMSVQDKVTVGSLTSALNSTAAATALGFANSTVNGTAFTGFTQNQVMQYLQFYNLFGLLWSGQFIIYTSFLAIAGTVSSWYFSRNSAECKAEKIPYFDLESEPAPCFGLCRCWCCRSHYCYSCFRTWRFHMGSVAFASLVVAIIAAIRLVVAYFQKKLEQTKADKNIVMRAVMCYVQYYLACIDCLVRMLGRNAFVFIAMKGYSFMPATGKALKFILANLIGAFGVLNVLTSILFLLGKFLMAGVAAAVCWGYLESDYSAFDVTSSWLPSAVCFVFAYVVGAVFLDVYDACIDTTLIVLLTDKAENGGVARHAKDKGSASDEDDVGGAVDNATGVVGGKASTSKRGCCGCRKTQVARSDEAPATEMATRAA
jgi:solute carrier family 44 (choline transporter-like protein), member 2/4/5